MQRLPFRVHPMESRVFFDIIPQTFEKEIFLRWTIGRPLDIPCKRGIQRRPFGAGHAMDRPDAAILFERTIRLTVPVRRIESAHFVRIDKIDQPCHRLMAVSASQRTIDKIILTVYYDQIIHVMSLLYAKWKCFSLCHLILTYPKKDA